MRIHPGIDAREHNANNPAWMTGIASPTIRLWSSGLLALSARGAGLIVSLDWPQNSDLRSAFAIC
jgi:hypothetical protein